jgi:hypothetical protein
MAEIEHVFELTFDDMDPVVVRGVRTFEYTTWDPEKGGCRRRSGDPSRLAVNSRDLRTVRLLAPDEIPPYAVPGTYYLDGVTYNLNDPHADRFGDRWEFDHWQDAGPMLRATVVDGIPIGTGAKCSVGDILSRFGPLTPIASPEASDA